MDNALDSATLDRMVGHVHYEWNMLHHTANHLRAIDSRGWIAPVGVKSALVESFAIHARNLIEFFSPTYGRYSTDLRAKHYVKNWKMPDSPALAGVYDRSSKRVQHLTTYRTSESDDEGWDILAIVECIDNAMSLFAAAAPRWNFTTTSRASVSTLDTLRIAQGSSMRLTGKTTGPDDPPKVTKY